MVRIPILVAAVAFSSTLALAQHGRALGHERPMGAEERGEHMGHGPISASAALTARPALAANLSTRLAPLLPAGMTLTTAAAGFKSLGAMLAALHISHNLNIPFAQLQAQMTGTSPKTLGQAIQALDPSLTKGDVKADVKMAERQTRRDLEESSETAGSDKN